MNAGYFKSNVYFIFTTFASLQQKIIEHCMNNSFDKDNLQQDIVLIWLKSDKTIQPMRN